MGTWMGTGLISFVSYGPAGSPFPSTFFGGEAAIRVTITPTGGGGVTFQATLTLFCVLGSPPPSSMEGVRLNVYDLVNFNAQSGGGTVFVAAT